MRKIIIILMFSFVSLFAVDAKLEIVKKARNLPSIVISSSNINSITLNKIAKTIKKDLEVSGHFNVLDFKLNTNFSKTPDMLVLGNNGADLYLNLDLVQSAFGGLNLKIKLYDVNKRTVVLNKELSSNDIKRYPFVSHKVAILVNKYLNAPSISWMDKFVIFSIYKSAKQAEIVIADYTLAYQKTIVKGGLNIFPKWANKNQKEFYYTTYNSYNPKVVKLNIYTGRKETIMESEGMVVASDVSSDGNKLLITAAPEGQPDIYLYDVRTKIKTRLTKYKGIDVGAHFVENDSKIVFVSDRLKYPNIFSKKIGSRGVERLIFHGRNNASASTYKNYVVYVSKESTNEFAAKTFNLYLVSTKSDFLKRLTTNGLNQFPKFSNDGESILYTKIYNGKSSLGIIRVNYNKTFLFPLKNGKLQSIDW